MRRNLNFPRCRQNKCDCQLNRDGKCIGLTDTQFDKPCPFYKPKPIQFVSAQTGPEKEDN